MMKKNIYIDGSIAFQRCGFGDKGIQVVDSTFTRTKLDQDSLYYDEMAYLDDYHFLDNIFVLGQVGISHSMSENTRFGNFFENEKLSFNFGVGKWFYPSFGLRITAGLHPQVGRAEWEISDAYPETFGNYNYNMFSGYVDGLVNLTNIILKYKEDRVFNLIGIIGLGYNHTFGFDKNKCAIMRRGLDRSDIRNAWHRRKSRQHPIRGQHQPRQLLCRSCGFARPLEGESGMGYRWVKSPSMVLTISITDTPMTVSMIHTSMCCSVLSSTSRIVMDVVVSTM